ncbi:uncharacterized protein LOC112184388 [Rosa chinensis]|uniref:uncharacterized protein LOC112184388 n=1 Tax=Rosa chinensis TaxID=74649 RepID=UPI000D092662|nr:uncharacterized protein LOC112184388 [Rosa chinensis]
MTDWYGLGTEMGAIQSNLATTGASVYQHKSVSPHLTIASATTLALEFQSTISILRTDIEVTPPDHDHQQTAQSRLLWKTPPPNYHKVNCDASWKAPHKAGIGIIIRNSNGELHCGAASPAHCGSIAEAEAFAILQGVSLAVTTNLRKVIIESDAKEVISDLREVGRRKNWRTYPILEQIRKKASSLEDCKWEWIPREANRVAHNAASLANGSVGPLRWATQPPPSLTLVLRNDGLPCPPMAEG